eukprot:411372-Rhodomonas_salina.1
MEKADLRHERDFVPGIVSDLDVEFGRHCFEHARLAKENQLWSISLHHVLAPPPCSLVFLPSWLSLAAARLLVVAGGGEDEGGRERGRRDWTELRETAWEVLPKLLARPPSSLSSSPAAADIAFTSVPFNPRLRISEPRMRDLGADLAFTEARLDPARSSRQLFRLRRRHLVSTLGAAEDMQLESIASLASVTFEQS